ncbi:type II toxin-antitoxin system CcdA family antitoxin [Glaciecola sp. 1036]|uniref:type II toxin-antitoxin system CcdA family antitoxin n=1 Tax=Alteromonadaceae TaxID=72275 RepID=UPI003CFD1975
MPQLYDLKAPKKPTNLSINSDLLTKARKNKINLSATLERALVHQLRQTERENWKNENRDAIEALNELTEKHGLFSDSFREF